MSFLIHEELLTRAGRAPDADAVVFADGTLSYAQLNHAAAQMAHALIAHGVQRNDRVGIFMDKCIDVPVAMYAIMKAGAAFVPLDPAAPSERVAAVLNDCAIHCLISAPSKTRALRALAKIDTPLRSVLGVDDAADLPFATASRDAIATAQPNDIAPVKVLTEDLAYIIYTSGSTGTPKGIMHSHRSGLSFARWAAAEFGLHDSDRLSNHAPLHFDLSIFDYFAALVAGACTVIVPEEYTKLPASYSQLLAEQRVTVLFTVPFALIQLALRGALEQRDLSALRWVLFGGEPFPLPHLRALMAMLPAARFDNVYGPAEINGVTHYTIDTLADDETNIPIGPIARCAEALVVDPDDVVLAPGTAGELLVRTPTMMHGYWNRPELNAKAFFVRRNPAGLDEVFFRTGDSVVCQADGVFRFLGRRDRQIKVRGYRIELDEIEAALCAHAAVEEGASFALPSAEGSQRIVAQATLKADADVTLAQLQTHLKRRLPWYAMPAELTFATQFPRTTTGKIDRRELRARALRALEG